MPDSVPIPLMPGPWLPLDGAESDAFRARLMRLARRGEGAAGLLVHGSVVDLRAMPLSFYPGWALVEGEALLPGGDRGTVDILYGPDFLWVIDGRSPPIHMLNLGLMPKTPPPQPAAGSRTWAGSGSSAGPETLPSPLAPLDETTTGPDYLHFFCASVWAELGPFWLVERPDAPVLAGVTPARRRRWQDRIAPIAMRRENGTLMTEVMVAYGDALFFATFSLDDQGKVMMIDDDPIARGVLKAQRLHGPFRNFQRIAPVSAPQRR